MKSTKKMESLVKMPVAEQEVLIKEEIIRFVKFAKEKGALTIEEINEQLPAEIQTPAVLDSFMHALEINGVVLPITLKKIRMKKFQVFSLILIQKKKMPKPMKKLLKLKMLRGTTPFVFTYEKWEAFHF